MSLIDEGGEKRVRMANLATVGSHAVNGVAALHSELLRETVLRDFAELWPERFRNVTNGVTPRRFLRSAIPRSRACSTRRSAKAWITDLARLEALEALADDAAFQERWRAVKRANKERLARHVRERTGIVVDPAALFDIQVKRIHEYKRQHLNVLHVIALYQRLRQDPQRAVAAALLRLRRQGRARLRDGEADHPPDQRRRRGGEHRSGRRRTAQGRVLPGLQRQERAARLPGRRPVRANLDGRQGGLRHRQHEVHDERRR